MNQELHKGASSRLGRNVRLVLRGLLLLAAACVMCAQEPLKDVHWDTPIYIYHSSRFLSDDVLAQYRDLRWSIAQMVDGLEVKDARFWSPFWHFSRIGHIAVSSVPFWIVSDVSEAIEVTQKLTGCAAAVGIWLASLAGLRLASLAAPTAQPNVTGAAATLSGVTYLLSDVSLYLGRSLVSETFALVLLSASIWVLLVALGRANLYLGALAGSIGALTYMVRMEAIWPYLATVAFLVAVGAAKRQSIVWYQLLLVSLGASLVVWLLYLLFFFPLPLPQYFLAFRAIVDKAPPEEASVLPIIAAAGFMLPAMVAFVFAHKSRRMRWLILAWLAVSVAPSVPVFLDRTSVQTRMFVPFVIMPCMLASTLGWSSLLEAKRRAFGAVFLGLVISVLVVAMVVSYSVAYEFVRSFPGLWRIQYAKAGMYPIFNLRHWEKTTYEYREIGEVAKEVIGLSPEPRVFSPANVSYGHQYLLVSYLLREGKLPHVRPHDILAGEPLDSPPCESAVSRHCAARYRDVLDGRLDVDRFALLVLAHDARSRAGHAELERGRRVLHQGRTFALLAPKERDEPSDSAVP